MQAGGWGSQRRWVSSGVTSRGSYSKALKKFLAPKIEPLMDDLSPRPVDPQWALIGTELLNTGRWFEIKFCGRYPEDPPDTFSSIPDLDEHLQKPNVSTLSWLLHTCARFKALQDGEKVHKHMLESGIYDKISRLRNLTLHMYATCGATGSAVRVYRKNHERNTFSHNAMMEAYILRGHVEKAVEVFNRIKKPQERSFNTIILALAGCGQMQAARKLFDMVDKRRDRTFNSMIAGYGQIGQPAEAKMVFDIMTLAGQSTGSWSALITAYIQNGLQGKAVALFDSMPHIRNWLSVSAAIVAYAQEGELSQAHKIYSLVPKHTVIASNALLFGYAQHGDLLEARNIFDKMEERSTTSWDLMVHAYVQRGYLQEARELFDQMPVKETSSLVVMLGAYIENGYLGEAKKIYDMDYRPDVLTTQMIVAFAQHGHLLEARTMLDEMPVRDKLAWAAVIESYAQAGDLKYVKELIEMEQDESEISLAALITANAQRGDLREARIVFDAAPEHMVVLNAMLQALSRNPRKAFEFFIHMPRRDSCSWNVMLEGYAQRGHVPRAKALFNRMPEHGMRSWNALFDCLDPVGVLEGLRYMDFEGLQPDKATFLSATEACLKLGAVEMGRVLRGFIADCGYQSDASLVAAMENMSTKFLKQVIAL